MNIGIDHGYYAIKTTHFSFPAGVCVYESEPYTLQNTLEYVGKFYVCGTGRQPLQRDKTANENYWLLTLVAIAKEIKQRGENRKNSIVLAAGLPLTSFGRDKLPFKKYLLRSSQPVLFKYEGEAYEIIIEDVKLFPQGYSALALHHELLNNEPSVLLMDIGGWTVDLMRLDNAVPNAASCRSLEMGVIRCIDEALEQVRRDVGLSVTEAQCECVLNGKTCILDERARSIIQNQGRLYTQRLLSAVMESGFDLKAMPVILLGGGAKLITRHISHTSLSPFGSISNAAAFDTANALQGSPGALAAGRDRAALCRAIPLLDARINAEGFERLLGQIQSR
ncbi:MAG: ParM/StbA family protein [Oscillospiraceae bacterium]